MKKVFLTVFVFVIFFFAFPKHILANCALTAVSTGVNNIVYISISKTTSGLNYSVTYYQYGSNSPIPGPTQISNGNTIAMSLQTPSTGVYRITAAGGSSDFCNDQQVTVTGGSSSGDVLKDPPKGWLKNIVPDFGPSPAFGIDFIKNNFIPFLISLMLFLIIVLSLIFTIIGGIMWTISGGNKEGMAKAKNTITYALIGLALGLSSFIIWAIVKQFFGFGY